MSAAIYIRGRSPKEDVHVRYLVRTLCAGRVREALAENRPVLFWPMPDYLILHKLATNPLEILSNFWGSRDVPVPVLIDVANARERP